MASDKLAGSVIVGGISQFAGVLVGSAVVAGTWVRLCLSGLRTATATEAKPARRPPASRPATKVKAKRRPQGAARSAAGKRTKVRKKTQAKKVKSRSAPRRAAQKTAGKRTQVRRKAQTKKKSSS
jgi:hypothetical protein